MLSDLITLMGAKQPEVKNRVSVCADLTAPAGVLPEPRVTLTWALFSPT